jgi:DNA-binding beta-propeller fold protein YncE
MSRPVAFAFALVFVFVFVLGACGTPAARPPLGPPPAVPAPSFTTSTLPLPGATADGVGMDYVIYDAATDRVWVPAGNTGAVDVIDPRTLAIAQVGGFATTEMERRGTKRTVGPSSATRGDGVVYVGNRGDSSVCAIDEHTLAKGACGTLDAMPDGIAYVAPTHEVWVTTPRDSSLRVLDAATLAQKTRIALPAGPEGFAVDVARGRFYTSFEDRDETIAIDLVTHATVATWPDHCGGDGPRGLRLAGDLLLVACHAQIEALAIDRGGAVAGSLATGEGVDDFDLAAATHLVYAAASAGTLTIGALDPGGTFRPIATVPTAPGARNGVVTTDGTVFVPHGKPGELVVIRPQQRSSPDPFRRR